MEFERLKDDLICDKNSIVHHLKAEFKEKTKIYENKHHVSFDD